jgi:Tfp pilus assembly protein PilX
MNNKPTSNQRSRIRRSRQAGVYTLVISMVLIGASMIAVRALTKTTVLETRITNNDQQSREVAHAAEAALDYGITWYAMSDPATWTVVGAMETGVPTGAIPTVTASNGDTYASTVTYSRDPTNLDFILVTATSAATSNASVTATVQQTVHTNYLLVDPDLGTAPLILDGCLTGVTGNPDIHPSGVGAVAVSTSQAPDCIDEGHLSYNGGSEAHSAFTVDLWSKLFDRTREEMEKVAIAEVDEGVADADRTVVWVTSTGTYHTSWGSPTHPVILIFAPEANCPMTNGSPVHYGVIFVDSDCTSAHGWGGTEVYGTVAINGNIGSYNSNTEITDWSLVTDSYTYNLKAGVAPRIPGSWRDF